MEKIALAELDMVVDSLLAKLPTDNDRATIVGLVGNLGAGKTTFVQALGSQRSV
jgi:tRNA A37 threonylcarbamoyladenosine biosynthesis protein TsaE